MEFEKKVEDKIKSAILCKFNLGLKIHKMLDNFVSYFKKLQTVEITPYFCGTKFNFKLVECNW